MPDSQCQADRPVPSPFRHTQLGFEPHSSVLILLFVVTTGVVVPNQVLWKFLGLALGAGSEPPV